MKQIKFIISLMLILLFVSCTVKTKTVHEQQNNQNIQSEGKNDSRKANDFEIFKSKFKPLKIKNISSLSTFYDTYQTTADNEFTKVESQYKKIFLQEIDTTYVYYGYQTEMPNGNVILSVINHCRQPTPVDNPDEIIDTTFLTSVIYDNSGNFLATFRTFGSNMTGVPPTYNMVSTFGSA